MTRYQFIYTRSGFAPATAEDITQDIFFDICWHMGLDLLSTLLCAIVVAVTKSYFYLFWNSVAWGVVFNILFGGILLWKTILYVVFLREIAELRRGKVIGAFIVMGIFIVLLVMVNGYVGIKTRVL